MVGSRDGRGGGGLRVVGTSGYWGLGVVGV